MARCGPAVGVLLSSFCTIETCRLDVVHVGRWNTKGTVAKTTRSKKVRPHRLLRFFIYRHAAPGRCSMRTLLLSSSSS